MKYETYLRIVQVIQEQSLPGDRAKCVATLRQQHPAFDVQTIGSIYSQEILKKVKKSFHKHASKADVYYDRFSKLCDDPSMTENDVIIFDISRDIDFPPSMLARMILERHLFANKLKATSNPESSDAREKPEGEALTQSLSVTKQEISVILRNPELLTDHPRLSSEIELCNVMDDDYGPLSDMIKQSIGHEREVFMKRRAKELHLVFKDEDQMRAEGYDKTPDLRLEIPIAVDGVVIHWIESKASFGDQGTHSVYLKDQFWSYQNRFGPGIVIYWFGFIEELDVNRSKGILLYDHLPEDFVVFDPAKI